MTESTETLKQRIAAQSEQINGLGRQLATLRAELLQRDAEIRRLQGVIVGRNAEVKQLGRQLVALATGGPDAAAASPASPAHDPSLAAHYGDRPAVGGLQGNVRESRHRQRGR